MSGHFNGMRKIDRPLYTWARVIAIALGFLLIYWLVL
jgi:hypothetical protein